MNVDFIKLILWGKVMVVIKVPMPIRVFGSGFFYDNFFVIFNFNL